MAIDTASIVKEIDEVMAQAEHVGGPVFREPIPDHKREWQASQAVMLLRAAIERYAPSGTAYLKQVANLIEQGANDGAATTYYFYPLMGILNAIRDDYNAGRMKSAVELLHADLFADFLEAAQHLLDEGYKDPAAVIAGSSLEAHLRKLADKHCVPTTAPDGSARKSSMLTADLAKTTPPALSKLDAKSVTAWLDLRNKAAHGHYADYDKGQVALLIAGVRDFISRTPA